jgi:hypothetical protein
MLKLVLLGVFIAFVSNTGVCGSFFYKVPAPAEHSDSVLVKVTADQNAFMCPFLTPMFIEKLKNNHAIGVHKKEDLSIHFSMSRAEFSEELLYKLAENVGYMRSLIHIEHHDK